METQYLLKWKIQDEKSMLQRQQSHITVGRFYQFVIDIQITAVEENQSIKELIS